MIKTPIVLILFNRPDYAKRVFDVIKRIKPSQLYIISDGPRSTKGSDEVKRVQETRSIVEQIDWKCDLKKKYSNINLGCKKNLSTGLDWVFSQTDQAIILEDDCIPNISFFYYCEELLLKYKDEEKVMHISGTNLINDKKITNNSYFFTKHISVWGWATWKRAWKEYDVKMKDYPSRSNEVLSHIFTNKRAKETMKNRMNAVVHNTIDTWDYQWTWAIWKNNGLAIMPQNNLVSNIGFGKKATHTKISGKYDSLKTTNIQIPLFHPTEIKSSINVDRLMENNLLIEHIVADLIIHKIKTFLK